MAHITKKGLTDQLYKKWRVSPNLQAKYKHPVKYVVSWNAALVNVRRAKLDVLWHWQSGECVFCAVQTWRFGEEGLGLPPGRRATLEHKRCVSEGGNDNLNNLAMSCSNCNSTRGVIDFHAFMNDRDSSIKERSRRIDAGKAESLARKREQRAVRVRDKALADYLNKTMEIA